MKNILLIFSLVLAITAKGQTSLLGVKGGISWTNGVSNNFKGDIDFRTGLSIGISYDYMFNKYFSTGIDIIYNQRGFVNNIVSSINSGDFTKMRETLYFHYDYITIPLKIGFNYGEKMYGLVNIGLTPSVLLDAKTSTKITLSNDEKFHYGGSSGANNVTDIVNKFDLGGFVEIGGGYKFKEKYWLYSTFSFQHSFTSITNKNYFSDSKIRHYGIILSLGMKICIN